MQQITNSCAYFTEHLIDFRQIYLCFDLLFLKTFLFNLVPSASFTLGTRLRIHWRFYLSCMTEVKRKASSRGRQKCILSAQKNRVCNMEFFSSWHKTVSILNMTLRMKFVTINHFLFQWIVLINSSNFLVWKFSENVQVFCSKFPYQETRCNHRILKTLIAFN